jgi:hypothetical protein
MAPAWHRAATTSEFLKNRFTRDAMGLSYREFRLFALEWRLKTQDDLIFRHPGRDQPIGNPILSAIVLNPDLGVLDINVHQEAVNPAVTVPSDVHQLVMALDRIEYRFDLDLAIGQLMSAIFAQEILNQLTVTAYFIHMELSAGRRVTGNQYNTIGHNIDRNTDI